MAKYITLVKRPGEMTREAFLAAFVREQAAVAKGIPGIARLVVDLVDVPAEEAGLRPGGQPAFDAVVETWLDRDPQASDFPVALAGELHTYAVAEKVEKERDWTATAGGVSPGVKSIYLAGRRKDQTHEEFSAHWGGTHAPLAVKHHIGMWRYVRNTVSRAVTPGSPDWDGFAELHFFTSQDLRERFYDSDEGRAVIAADIAKFSGAGKQLHTSEHVLIG